MKKVTLQSITLRNFRGEKERTTRFNATGETTISGDNGLGKSRHFDAFVWILFGKDTSDRKDFNIKTIVNGEPLQRVNCEASCVLDVDGDTVTLRRVHAEKWVKPRGQVEERFDGHETEFYWNDVPLKAGEYQSRVNAIITDSVFKMITNPAFFAGMKWQDQREQLFQLAGTITDREIAARSPEYAALLDKISGKSLADFKREISAREKKLKDELDQIQPRIDQTQKLMPEPADFAALETEIAAIDKQIADLDKAIADQSEAARQQGNATRDKQRRINELKQEQQQALFDARTKAREDAFAANEQRRGLENDIKIAEASVALSTRSVNGNLKTVKELENLAKIKREEVEKLRQAWHAENAKEYEENDACLVCPAFGVNCSDSAALARHAENKETARAMFIKVKQSRLEDITEKGKKLAAEADALDKEKDELLEASNELQAKSGEQIRALEPLKAKLAAMPPVDETTITAADLPAHAALSARIQVLEAELHAMELSAPPTSSSLNDQKTALLNEIAPLRDRLRDRVLIATCNEEIATLNARGKDLARQIADLEREEYIIQNFTKAKIEECERRVNGLFTMVTFKLFDYTIDGNESETCVPLVDGVPFGVANSAGRVNAGLDIINALVKFHGVSAPIFIDGRESVNRLIPTTSQIINLVVTNDKELIIK